MLLARLIPEVFPVPLCRIFLRIVTAAFGWSLEAAWIDSAIRGVDLYCRSGLSKDLVSSILADRDGTAWLPSFGGLNRSGDVGGRVLRPFSPSRRESRLSFLPSPGLGAP